MLEVEGVFVPACVNARVCVRVWVRERARQKETESLKEREREREREIEGGGGEGGREGVGWKRQTDRQSH